MEYFCLFLATVIVGIIVYAWLATRWDKRREKQVIAETLPEHEDVRLIVQAGARYEVVLSDGRRFVGVEILGVLDYEQGKPFTSGYGGTLLVLRLDNGKRAWVRQGSVRCIIEMESLS